MLMSNEELKAKYDSMHKQGTTAWFSDGQEERETILKMGEPWKDVEVLEIGCGEGELVAALDRRGAFCVGIDYSHAAIKRATERFDRCKFSCKNYKDAWNTGTSLTKAKLTFSRLVMQGVLEHLDNPFGELQWMIERFKPKTVITSSPCFLNPRGIVWMTLDMLGAVMSKTDLHWIDPHNFEDWCKQEGYRLTMESCDYLWGNGIEMLQDLRQRIPLALKDGNISFEMDNLGSLLDWLAGNMGELSTDYGATMVYRIDV